MRETLEKEVRLSYYDRVKTTIPEKFTVIMAPQPPAPSQELLNADHPHNDIAKQILGMLRQKKGADELNGVLAEVKQRDLESGRSQEQADETAREVFTQCVLLLGAKSFSHVLNVIERYK
jgi:nuclear cap-binding protein subunit 1